MERLPEHGPCFVCGTANPSSMGFVFYQDGERIIAEGRLTSAQQGPPGHAHGGSLASILDEAMGWVLWRLGYKVVAAHLEFDYRNPTPLDVPLRVEAQLGKKGHRSIQASSKLFLEDGTVTVEGKGVFVELGDDFVKRFGAFWGSPPTDDEAATH